MKIGGGWDTPRENVSGICPRIKGRDVTAQVCAGGDVRLEGWWWTVRAHARGLLPSALQSRRCVYPAGVIDGGLPLRVMCELSPITLGRNEFSSDLFRYRAPCSRFFGFGFDGFVPVQLEGVSICKGALLVDHQELTTILGPSKSWACAATSPDKFVSRGGFRYLRPPSDQCPRRTYYML